MIFRSKSASKVENTANLTGFSMETPLSSYDTKRAQVCLAKAVLVFSASLGTVGSIVSAFSLEINMPLIVACLFVFSLILAFLHYNHVLFNLLYPVIFFVFSYSIIQYRTYVNSGFQGIMNLIREQYRDYFDLNYARQTSEAISNRYLTMTIAFVFLGFFLALMVNIAISNYMSTFFTILMTFPFLQFGLYIGAIPSALYLFLLLFSYVTTMLLKRGGHFMLSENKKKDKPFTQKKHVISYKGNGTLMLELCALGFVLCFALTSFTYPIMQSHFLETEDVSAPKEFTDHYIKLLVQNGLFSFFNRYQAVGGMNDGRLGGISSVSSDQETDLTVTFVPTSMDTVYLKGFTGERYTGDAWLSPDYDDSELQLQLGAASFKRFEQYSSQLEATRLASLHETHPDSVLEGKMTIQKADFKDDHIYLPYYTQNSDSLPVDISHSTRLRQTTRTSRYKLSYFPLTKDYLSMTSPYDDILINRHIASAEEIDYINFYDMYQKLYYKTVSESCRKALVEATDEIGTAKSIMELVEKTKQYFQDNYEYTLSPGTTPMDQDFISYFIQAQKEGFCVHFASAGTMIMRSYGIPARYCEGYVIKLSNLADATILENESIDDWLSGNPDIMQSGVVTVEIPDANAHAWTEIYIDGFGWYPVDFTPYSISQDEQEENESIFSSLFSGMFGIGDSSDSISERVNGQSKYTKATRNLFLLVPTLAVLLFMLLFVITMKLIRKYKRYAAMRKACSLGNYNAYVSYQYEKLLLKLMHKKMPVSKQTLPSDVFALLTTLQPMLAEQLAEAYDILEHALYSREFTSKEKAGRFVSITNQACKHLKLAKTN